MTGTHSTEWTGGHGGWTDSCPASSCKLMHDAVRCKILPGISMTETFSPTQILSQRTNCQSEHSRTPPPPTLPPNLCFNSSSNPFWTHNSYINPPCTPASPTAPAPVLPLIAPSQPLSTSHSLFPPLSGAISSAWLLIPPAETPLTSQGSGEGARTPFKKQNNHNTRRQSTQDLCFSRCFSFRLFCLGLFPWTSEYFMEVYVQYSFISRDLTQGTWGLYSHHKNISKKCSWCQSYSVGVRINSLCWKTNLKAQFKFFRVLLLVAAFWKDFCLTVYIHLLTVSSSFPAFFTSYSRQDSSISDLLQHQHAARKCGGAAQSQLNWHQRYTQKKETLTLIKKFISTDSIK